MLVTLTTTSQNLGDILSASQITQALGNKSPDDTFQIAIQILGTQNVYLEAGADATVAGGLQLTQTSLYEFKESRLSDINLISEGVNNTNVRIVIN